MKNLISFITLLIFILSISDQHVISSEAQAELPDPVLDGNGDNLTTGTSYYLWPTFRPGGGVTLYPTANKNCTFGVAQFGIFEIGLPATFSNGGSDLGEVIRESTDLMISFSFGMFLFPTNWKVDEYDPATKQYFVTVGEIEGNTGNETNINYWFQIRKDASGDYMFAFCPKVCEFCAEICTNVGIYVDGDGVRRFALDGNFPSSFNFLKSLDFLKF